MSSSAQLTMSAAVSVFGDFQAMASSVVSAASSVAISGSLSLSSSSSMSIHGALTVGASATLQNSTLSCEENIDISADLHLGVGSSLTISETLSVSIGQSMTLSSTAQLVFMLSSDFGGAKREIEASVPSSSVNVTDTAIIDGTIVLYFTDASMASMPNSVTLRLVEASVLRFDSVILARPSNVSSCYQLSSQTISNYSLVDSRVTLEALVTVDKSGCKFDSVLTTPQQPSSSLPVWVVPVIAVVASALLISLIITAVAIYCLRRRGASTTPPAAQPPSAAAAPVIAPSPASPVAPVVKPNIPPRPSAASPPAPSPTAESKNLDKMIENILTSTSESISTQSAISDDSS